MEPQKKSGDVSNARQRSVRYPRHSLEKVEVFARAAFNEGARNLDVDNIAQAAGYKNAVNGAFAALRASAIEFGLVKSSGGYISVSEPWIEAFNSEDLDQLKQMRQGAILQSRLYHQLFDDYKERQLPSTEKLTRDLHLNQKYGVLKDAASSAAQIFLESVKYAELVDSKNFLKAPNAIMEIPDGDDADGGESDVVESKPEAKQTNRSYSARTTVFDISTENLNNLDRIAINLSNGKTAYLFMPSLLPPGEKKRLKQFIDLLQEEMISESDVSYQHSEEKYRNEP